MNPVEGELQALMIAALAGDEQAYRTILARLSGYLRGYYKIKLTNAGRSTGDAEDLVQETLMALHVRRHTYDPTQPFTPWLYAIARYKLIDFLRRTKSLSGNVSLEDAEAIVARDDRSATESALDLNRLLEHLPPKIRTAVRCVKLDGLSVADTAARTGMSESAVKVNVHRGIRMLSALLRGQRR